MQSAVLKLLAAERQAAAVPIPPPAMLDAVGGREVGGGATGLQARGNVGHGDLTALECLCSSWSLWLSAQAKVAELGMVTITPTGKVENPYLGIARKAQVAIRQWASELKLTPKSRKLAENVVPAGPESSKENDT